MSSSVTNREKNMPRSDLYTFFRFKVCDSLTNNTNCLLCFDQVLATFTNVELFYHN